MPLEQAPQLASAQFLHERDPNLQKSPDVSHTVDYLNQSGEGIPNQPAERIQAHLDFLREPVNDGILTGDQESVDRQIEAALVKEDDVPEAYFDFRKRIFREQGYGDVQLTPGQRHELVEIDQQDQKERLKQWTDYLSSDDAGYPDWFKHYVWESVVRLKAFDKEKQAFTRRSRGTTAIFPELDAEALSYVFDALNGAYVEHEKPEDEGLAKLIKSGNFAKLYAHAIQETAPEHSLAESPSTTEGAWVVYKQSEDPETAVKLSSSLAGHGTGWCTAGRAMAELQLKQGDFHVYYSKDKDGGFTNPRIAVRMRAGKVVEVRGILPGQELEPELIDTTAEHITDLPGGGEYMQKVDDMKRVTEIDDRLRRDPTAQLTADELYFVYEIDREIKGFGYNKDPRLKQITETRGLVTELHNLGEPVDETFVTRVLNGGHPNIVLDNIDDLEPLTDKAINRLIEENHGLALLRRAHAAEQLDTGKVMEALFKHDQKGHLHIGQLIAASHMEPMDVASRILEDGGENTVVNLLFHYSDTPGVDKVQFTHQIIDKGYASSLLHYNGAVIAEMSADEQNAIADHMIRKGEDYEVARNLDVFKGVDRDSFARHLLETGQSDIIFWQIGKFSGVDRAALAEQVLREGKVPPVQLLMALNQFPEMDRQEVAKRLMEEGDYLEIASNMQEFKDLDPLDLLSHMVAHGESDYALGFIHHEGGYSGKDFEVQGAELAQRLIETGQGDFVRNHLYELGITGEQYFDIAVSRLPRPKRYMKKLQHFFTGSIDV